ncbi:MAG TPA: hypothetical protein PKE40_03700 [Arachnia sp.]|nr:hypothetical protein [Arachnia sp.]
MSMRAEAQLSYASVDRGGGPGGWQVKELLGDLSPELVQQIVHDIASQLPTPSDAGRFVSRQEAEQWPRRLLYCELEESGVRIAIHSAAAGTDRSGRSGNVFSHVLVVDRGNSGSAPISLWRSADWLTPFGPDEVSDAVLRDEPFHAPSGPVSEVQAFLASGEAWRTGILAVLLDLVGAAMRGGKAPVLVVGSTDEAAAWVKAVSACLPPRAVQGFYFSTLEPPSRASAMVARLHLICVLRSELGRAPAAFDDLIVMDADTDVEVGTSSGQPHVLGDGTEVPAGEWSQAVFDFLAPGADLSARVEGLAALEEGISGQATNPAWWLWAYLAHEDPSALEECATLLARYAPPDVDRNQIVMPLVNRAMALTMGTTAAERWAALDEMLGQGTRGVTARSATEQYLALALADGPWLLRRSALPAQAWGETLSVQLAEAVNDAVPSADAMSADDRIVVYVRLLDAINRGTWTRASVAPGARKDILGELEQVVIVRGLGSSLAVDEDLHPQTEQDLVSALRLVENPEVVSRQWLERLDMIRVPDLAAEPARRKPPGTPLDRRIARELLADLLASGRTARTSRSAAEICGFALLVLASETDGEVIAGLARAEVTAELCAEVLRSPNVQKLSLRVVCSALFSADPWAPAAQELMTQMRVVGRADRHYWALSEGAEAVRSLPLSDGGVFAFGQSIQYVLRMLVKVYRIFPDFRLDETWNALLRIAALCSSLEDQSDPPPLPEVAVSSAMVRSGIKPFQAALKASRRDALEFVLPVRVADWRFEAILAPPRRFGETESGRALSAALAEELIVVLVRQRDADLDQMIEDCAVRMGGGSVDAEKSIISALNKWAKSVPELPRDRASRESRSGSILSRIKFRRGKEGGGR